ncbi:MULTISPECIES: FtsX-like permease family protein [unclassified Streptomyces]|uniref:FtsX-like permease family protein n=1 Tax=unclassified Streptomyces TaxID=2593676 RepID=UPI0030CDB782
MIADLRIALLLTRGSDRREGWRVALTAVGAALATGLCQAAVAVASLQGQYSMSLAHGLLDQPGERAGVVLTLLLLLVPVLGFLGQCARIGAVHRDRRLAGLRLVGATPAQVRRIAALEAGLACLTGSVVAGAVAAWVLAGRWQSPPVAVWAGCAGVALAVPVLGALVSALALRRVVASPLGWVRRVRPDRGRGPGIAVLLTALVTLLTGITLAPRTFGGFETAPLFVFGVVIITGVGAVWAAGASARLIGRVLAERTGNPAVLIAAERLRDDPWAGARTHAAVLLVTVVGTGFVGVRQVLLAALTGRDRDSFPANLSFYTTGLDLTGAAILLALAITLSGLAVGTAESLATRRRGLAAQVAGGVPRAVLGRALILETALPLAPAVALAGAGGLAIGVWYGQLAGGGIVPVLPLVVPVAVYAAALLAAGTSLPLLRRSVRPAELRHA